jgi:hypothetical protein
MKGRKGGYASTCLQLIPRIVPSSSVERPAEQCSFLLYALTTELSVLDKSEKL